jgi:hypothetical protein
MKYFILLLCIFIATSCAKIGNTFIKTDYINISDYMIPAHAALSDTVKLSVRAQADNGCWRNLLVYLNKESHLNYSIKAYGTYESKGACPIKLVYKDTVINFIPADTGMYLFYVYDTPLTYKSDTLTVN